ncbi:hypothetical protein BH11CYA1_BH11CYA1_10050 [soil metagenome]
MIPLDVLTRYPGVIVDSELVRLGNIKAIPIMGLITVDEDVTTRRSLGNTQIVNFFQDWEKFFETHKSPTKAVIVSFRDTTTSF